MPWGGLNRVHRMQKNGGHRGPNQGGQEAAREAHVGEATPCIEIWYNINNENDDLPWKAATRFFHSFSFGGEIAFGNVRKYTDLSGHFLNAKKIRFWISQEIDVKKGN